MIDDKEIDENCEIKRKQQQTRQADLVKVIADPTRIEILSILKVAQGTMSVTQIVTAIGSLAQPTISHHLRILYGAQVVERQKMGVHSFYSVNFEKMHEINVIVAKIAEKRCDDRQ